MWKNYLFVCSIFLCSLIPLCGQVTVNGSLGADGTYTTLSAAFENIKNYNQSAQNITVAVTADITEVNTVRIQPSAYNLRWQSLIIYPSGGTRTITYEPTATEVPLFQLYHASNVKFIGRLEGADNGAGKNLIIRGANTGTSIVDATILFSEGHEPTLREYTCSNINIEDCVFEVAPTAVDRPTLTITGNAYDIFIKDNYFKNSLCQSASTVQIISVINTSNSSDLYPSNNWQITGNHFFETERLIFKHAIHRHFINVFTSSQTCDFIVEGNYIGGSAPYCSGTMYMGTSTENSPEAGETSTSLTPIYVIQNATTVTNKRTSVSNNKIANIDITNHTNNINFLGQSESSDTFAEFCGIRTEDGIVDVKNNNINNIICRSKEPQTVTTDIRYITRGISCLAAGSYDPIAGQAYWSEFLCDGNQVTDLRTGVLPLGVTGNGHIIKSYSIEGQSHSNSLGVLSNNRVVWGHNDDTRVSESSDIGGIEASTWWGYGSEMKVYNNICVLDEFKYPNEIYHARLIKIQDLDGSSPDGKGIDCYNNIAYVQPRSSIANESFSVSNILIGGIVVEAGMASSTTRNKTNIFHNTVLINDLNTTLKKNLSSMALGFLCYGTISYDAWNNNLINLDSKGYVLHTEINSATPFPTVDNIRIDYNNFYRMSNYFALINEWGRGVIQPITTFDMWKFGNKSTLFNRGSEQDFHSYFRNPVFAGGNTISISTTGTDEEIRVSLNSLREKLQPKTFIAGIKTDNSIIASGSNTDFSSSPTLRHEQAPTIGAINTAFSNYWKGTQDSDWNNAGNWGEYTVPADGDDVIFDPVSVTNHLEMNEDHTVRDLFNISGKRLLMKDKNLTVTQFLRISGDDAKIDATTEGATLTYKGQSGGAGAQHIYPNTFIEDEVYNLTIGNMSDYFTVLHDKLNITNDLINALTTDRSSTGSSLPYPKRHMGGLNCIWFNSTLTFSGISEMTMPQNVIFNDSVYNLTDNCINLITQHDLLYVNNDLTIGSASDQDKAFRIPAGKFVKVDGVTTNYSGVEGLHIGTRQDNSETTPNATFIFNNKNVGDPKIAARVGMFSPAHKDASGNYKWQYFTVPVEEVDPIWNFPASWIRRWDPTGKNRSSYYGTPYWIYLENNHTLSPIAGRSQYTNAGYSDAFGKPANTTSYALQGYQITTNTAKLFNIGGYLVNSDFSLNLDYNEYDEDNKNGDNGEIWTDQKAYDGQYIVGNPYTAAINIDKLDFGANLDSTVYIYTTGSYDDWNSAGNTSGIAAGQYQAIPQKNAGIAGLPSSIPSMQGFLIMRNDATGTVADNTFTLKYDATESNKTVSRNTQIQRSVDSENTRSYANIELSCERYTDYLWIFIESGCKKGYDNGWDGRKFINKYPAQLCTMEDGMNFQISTMDDLNDTYIGVLTGDKNIEYTLKFNYTNFDILYQKIELIDLTEGKIIDISRDNSTYTFTANASDELQKRFRISTDAYTETDINKTPNVNQVSVYAENKTIFINNHCESEGTMYLYDITGKCLLTKRFTPNSITTLNTKLPAGSYIINLSTPTGNINKSLIIK